MRYLARAPAIDELDIAALCPAQGLKGLPENHDPRLPFWVIRDTHQHANTAHAIRLLRAHRERPSRRAAQKNDECTPLHAGHRRSSCDAEVRAVFAAAVPRASLDRFSQC